MATRASPATAIQKISAGPRKREARASGGVKNTSTRAPNAPPTVPANSEVYSASWAWPCWVKGVPSRVVQAAPEVPGVLIRMAEIEPPYSADM